MFMAWRLLYGQFGGPDLKNAECALVWTVNSLHSTTPLARGLMDAREPDDFSLDLVKSKYLKGGAADTLDDPRAKLFLVKPEDTAALEQLQQLYPLGSLSVYDSAISDRDFYIFLVPPAGHSAAPLDEQPQEFVPAGQ